MVCNSRFAGSNTFCTYTYIHTYIHVCTFVRKYNYSIKNCSKCTVRWTLHQSAVVPLYIDRDPLWSNNSKNNVGNAETYL